VRFFGGVPVFWAEPLARLMDSSVSLLLRWSFFRCTSSITWKDDVDAGEAIVAFVPPSTAGDDDPYPPFEEASPDDAPPRWCWPFARGAAGDGDGALLCRPGLGDLEPGRPVKEPRIDMLYIPRSGSDSLRQCRLFCLSIARMVPPVFVCFAVRRTSDASWISAGDDV